MAADRFPSPFEVPTPDGAEGWESMYDWYHLFGPERRELDEQRFWFADRLHHPDVLHPYDEIQCECWWQALGAFNTRVFAMPPAFGVDQRIVNGRLYVTPVPAPPEDIAARAEEFGKRAGHYYERWDAIYDEWRTKVMAKLEEIRALRFDPLPDLEPEETVYQHTGHSAGFRMIRDFDRLVLTMYETYQYHFELLNIGYAAYLTFFGMCRAAFPDISDQSISRMVGGLRVDLYRPDDELKRLAKEAVRLGLAERITATEDAASLFADLRSDAAGAEWVADWERTADPWFLINTDPGHPGGYHTYPTWADDPNIPLASVREYLRRLADGTTIDRPTDEVLAERDRITAGYRELLPEAERATFDDTLALARQVFVYIEEHVLYIEHWMWATFWAKSHELSRALAAMGEFDEPEDMFFLRRYEVAEAIYDCVAGWSVGSRPRGADYWRPIIARRREIYTALRAWEPPPALGPPPTTIDEPFTVMLWGITTSTVAEWLRSDSEEGVLRGTAGSPGVVEGPVRVVTHPSELPSIEPGDILVCPATSPSWAPVFGRVAATVSDVGGIMSHTAIVCREYGLPAVVGTGNAVSTLRTGQRVRVDGSAGVVTVLEPV
ncbi:PEP-utilizing enzyme [Actinomycetospora chibensis]|uniref:PEP-utilizing enzyme n=1 Tax=Actinomycetospora chibensis TaxID=663606 RepID=A0ABV9RQ23_9PSEU|nr:PEP-utilizing enzyme [Actinomycetospora chibensis]MDD7922379.1 PEP-utilizing enzyme [Actinomycetospora chibensis]